MKVSTQQGLPSFGTFSPSLSGDIPKVCVSIFMGTVYNAPTRPLLPIAYSTIAYGVRCGLRAANGRPYGCVQYGKRVRSSFSYGIDTLGASGTPPPTVDGIGFAGCGRPMVAPTGCGGTGNPSPTDFRPLVTNSFD